MRNTSLPPFYYYYYMTKSLAFSIFRTNYLFSTFQSEQFSHLENAYLALIGGCRWIQLSMNDTTDDEIEHTVRQLKAACEGADAVLTLEGHVELAQRLQVDGVYLTKEDMPANEARKILGEDRIVGCTAHTFNDIRLLQALGADYACCGPFRQASAKKDFPAFGLAGYRTLIHQMQAHNIDLPLMATGGLTEEDIEPLTQLGTWMGIDMTDAIIHADNLVKTAQQIKDKRFGAHIEKFIEEQEY